MTITTTRRVFLATAGACAVAGLAGPHALAAPGDAKVTLLGTKGGPRVSKGRANSSNLVTAAADRERAPALWNAGRAFLAFRQRG